MYNSKILFEIKEIINFILQNSSGIGLDFSGKTNLIDLKNNDNDIYNKIITPFYELRIPFSAYKEKLYVKSRNQYPRVISIPSYKDKIILKLLSNRLNRKIGTLLSQREIAQIKINKIKDCLDLNQEHIYCLKIDIENFYPSVDHNILRNILISVFNVNNLGVIYLLKYLENPTLLNKEDNQKKNTQGLPQGLAISNILAECYLKKFDDINSNQFYFRYVDDILIFKTTESECLDELEKINDILKNYNLKINSEKTEIKNLLNEPINYLGYSITYSNNKKLILSVKEKNFINFKSKINDFFRFFNLEKRKYIQNKRFIDYHIWKLNLLITGFKADSRRYGWLHYYSNINDTFILKKLDKHLQFILTKNNDLNSHKEKIKTFKESFSLIKKNSDKIPDMNTQYQSLVEKRNFLDKIAYFYTHEYLNTLSDKEVESLFNELYFKLIKELEKDDQIIFSSGDGI